MKKVFFVAAFALSAILTSCQTSTVESNGDVKGTEDSTKVENHGEHTTVTTPSVDSVKTETKTEKK